MDVLIKQKIKFYIKITMSFFVLKLLKIREVFNRYTHKYMEFKRSNSASDYTKPINKYKFVCILDEFSYNCFKYEADFVQLSRDNYKNEINEEKPDFLFVESAWSGLDGKWELKKRMPRKHLYRLIRICKNKRIPTIFWCKEDPVHFNEFILVASRFDYVFTTDSNCIKKYKKFLGHDRIYTLPFAAQPKIHNPIKEYERENKVCYAGTFHRDRFDDRAKELCIMLEASAKYGLDIYDRNIGREPELYAFPQEYQKNIKGKLPYSKIKIAYKAYRVGINTNTVKISPTMFSRRVFEMLACGTPLISNYSIGMINFFNGIVKTGKTIEEYDEEINRLISDEKYYKDLVIKGIREVFDKHTYKHRIKYMFECIGANVTESTPKVLVIIVNSDESMDMASRLVSYERQSLTNKELLIISDNKMVNYLGMKTDIRSDKKAMSFKEVRSCISMIENQFEFVAYLDNYTEYKNNYLKDLYHSTFYANAEAFMKMQQDESFFRDAFTLRNCFEINRGMVKSIHAIKLIDCIENKKKTICNINTFLIDDSEIKYC